MGAKYSSSKAVVRRAAPSECVECGSWRDYYSNVYRGRKIPLTCSRSCQTSMTNRARAGESRPYRRKVVHTAIPMRCPGCFGWHDGKESSNSQSKIKQSCGCSVPRTASDFSKFKQTDCRVCGRLCTSIQKSKGGILYCSDDCRKEFQRDYKREFSNKYQKLHGKRQDTHRKRARSTGAKYVPGITAKKVALRDGMRCQLCGVRVVPHVKLKRGKYNPRAWSIGHIVAMLGPESGDHTWGNVQCECVECNSAKGVKSLGQISMVL